MIYSGKIQPPGIDIPSVLGIYVFYLHIVYAPKTVGRYIQHKCLDENIASCKYLLQIQSIRDHNTIN